MRLLLNGGGNLQKLELTINKLDRIIDHNKSILYVPLAVSEEDYSYDDCYQWFINLVKDIDCLKIDMTSSFEDFSRIDLNMYSAIFIGGGNTYRLLKGLKENNIFDKLVDYLNNEGVVLGCSAGAIIFGYDINSCLVMDKNNVDLKDTKGFDVLNGKSIFAHYTNAKKEEVHNRYTNYLIEYSKNNEDVVALAEEDTIFICDNDITIIGDRPYYMFVDGKRIKFDVECEDKVHYQMIKKNN